MSSVVTVAGSVFETHELSNLVSVIASASLKESIRLAALQQVHKMFTEYKILSEYSLQYVSCKCKCMQE